MIVAGGGICRIETVDGTALTIIGDLAPILADFEGDKVWVIGEIGGDGARVKRIRVTGYGVIKRTR
jgi:hypothetical protein